MFKDEHRGKVWDRIRQHDIRAFADRLTFDVVQNAAVRAGVALGAGPLNLVNLIWLALASALHSTKNFADVLTLAWKLLQDQQAFASTSLGRAPRARRRRHPCPRRSKHDPRRDDPTVVSEEAFTKARRLLPGKFWIELILLLIGRIERAHSKQLCWKGFRLLALDGTVIGLPHWKRLREYYGAATNGRRACRTQARMVMLQFPLARLPYCYAVAPLKRNEIPLAMSLMEQVRPNDLVLMDRGYFSYGMFCALQQRGAFFAVRLKSRIALQTIRSPGTAGSFGALEASGLAKKMAQLARVDPAAGDPLSNSGIPGERSGNERDGSEADRAGRMGAAGDPTRGGPEPAAGPLPPALGDRDDVPRTESNAANGRRTAQPDRRGNRV